MRWLDDDLYEIASPSSSFPSSRLIFFSVDSHLRMTKMCVWSIIIKLYSEEDRKRNLWLKWIKYSCCLLVILVSSEHTTGHNNNRFGHFKEEGRLSNESLFCCNFTLTKVIKYSVQEWVYNLLSHHHPSLFFSRKEKKTQPVDEENQ